MTRSNRLAKDRTWQLAWALVQMDTALALVSLLQNNTETSSSHTTQTETDRDIQVAYSVPQTGSQRKFKQSPNKYNL